MIEIRNNGGGPSGSWPEERKRAFRSWWGELECQHGMPLERVEWMRYEVLFAQGLVSN